MDLCEAFCSPGGAGQAPTLPPGASCISAAKSTASASSCCCTLRMVSHISVNMLMKAAGTSTVSPTPLDNDSPASGRVGKSPTNALDARQLLNETSSLQASSSAIIL